MKNRLDKEMVERNLVPSRAKAQELINSNHVTCNGKVINKSNFLVSKEDEITISNNDSLKYVSRAGLKLEKAIIEFNIDFKNLNVMDIGSSTGGFTDCALQHGASHVVAVDVGTNLLHKSLRNHNQIDLYEQTNFKNFESKHFQNIDIMVCDVSFISLKQIIEKIASENVKVEIVCLIKPQFECGKEIATKYRGVILNKDIHIAIITSLKSLFNELGFYMNDLTFSPIKGGDGNIEYLTYLSNKIDKNSNIDISDIVFNAFS